MYKSNTISANTLFHFTESLDYLIGILTNNFYPRLCLENHSVFFPEYNQYISELALPMICFCDIPLSNIRNHVGIYGEYAIGLTKEWGKKNNISPVMYFLGDSISVQVIKACFKHIDKCLKKSNKHMAKVHYGDANFPTDEKDKLIDILTDELASVSNGLVEILGFTKQYSGSFFRNGKEYKDVCFYDEREWRYVPDIYTFPEELPTFMPKKTYLDQKKRRVENTKLETQEVALRFTPSDIKYIILSKENEILPMVDKIKKIKGDKYTLNDIELLATRIISMEQILQDF